MRIRFGYPILVLFLFLGCATSTRVRQLRPGQQEEIGTVHVAVQSVAPFEESINALQPQFSLTPEKALEAAIQKTQVEDSQLLRTLAVTLAAEMTGASSKTETEKLNAVLEKLTLPGDSVSIDQSLRYRAATALLQQVALLNTYVKDAAVRENAHPYVVRMLLTLTPAARALPYDAYSTISFFSRDPVAKHECLGETVEVIPLLATDNFEASLHQDSTQRMNDFAASLKAQSSAGGAGAGAHVQSGDANKTMANNLNSLFTVARLSANTIEARLGAAFANGSYAMTARTYDVPLLVILPPGDNKGCREVVFAASTYMRDAERGTLIPSGGSAALDHELRTIADRLHVPYDANRERLEELVDVAGRGDFPSFVLKFEERFRSYGPAVWNDFLTVAGRLGRSTGRFEVPTFDRDLFSYATKTTLFDDGRRSRLELTGASDLVEEMLSATLKVDLKDGPSIYVSNSTVAVTQEGHRATFEFPSLKRLTGKSPENLWVTVRSEIEVRKWQKSPSENVYVWYPARLRSGEPKFDAWDEMVAMPCEERRARNLSGYPDEIGCRPYEEPLSYFFVANPDHDGPDPGFSMSVPAIALVNGGTADVPVEFRSDAKEKRDVHFLVEGAYVGSIEPDLKRQGADYVTQTDSAYVLHLKNAHVASPVRVRAFRIDRGKKVFAPDAIVELR